MASRVRQGTDAERRAMQWLLHNTRATHVLRMARSHGEADLVAAGDGEVWFIGVRSGGAPRHTPAERAGLRELMEAGGDCCEAWEWLERSRGAGHPREVTFRRIEPEGE